MSGELPKPARRRTSPIPPNLPKYLENPFVPGITGHRLDLDQVLKEWIDGGRVSAMLAAAADLGPEGPHLVAIAVGHHQACRKDARPDRVLTPAELPPKLAEQFGIDRSFLLPTLMASGRCYRLLRPLTGTAPAFVEAKRSVWAACFGRTLALSAHLERLVRRHHVLLHGESGSGKESLAEAVQLGTPGGADGKPAPATQINCAAIAPSLIDSELFGHVRGAFTDAKAESLGRLREANGGALFLDEVAELSAEAQAKLLRAIEKKEVRPVGGDKNVPADVRFVSATHADLDERVGEGRFRHDLRARLAATVIEVPPLRERLTDLQPLALAMLEEDLQGGTGVELEVQNAVRSWTESEEARRHPWKGNIRELRTAVQRLLLGLDPLRREQGRTPPLTEAPAVPPELSNARWRMEEVRGWYLRKALAAEGGHRLRTAQRLGVDPKTLSRWLKEER